jgi:hypothetical protein
VSHPNWRRVSKAKPCPICEKPDWCLVAADGNAAICARVESSKRCGEAGWLHQLRDETLWRLPRHIVRQVRLTSAGPRLDLASLAAAYQQAVDPVRLDEFARSLGLSVEALAALGIGWSAENRAWSFPMSDTSGHVLGIRLRRPECKFAVRGSKEGLFLPTMDPADPRLLVCEGPTDTAALLDMGLAAVAGRPSCTGGIRLLVELAQRRRPAEVVVVADSDEPGRRGADNLASVLVAYVPTVRVVTPPAGIKDARAWLQAGGTRDGVEEVISAASVRRLMIRATTEKGG